jgi:pimeloyl-ACP methyl ester carboxylesterase
MTHPAISTEDPPYRKRVPVLPVAGAKTMTLEGPASLSWDGAAPRPFQIVVEDSVLEDLKRRLRATRWPDQIPGESWRHGTDLEYLKALCGYWHDSYDWRKTEAELNRFKQYKVVIGGTEIHFIHEPGEGLNPRPLLLSHGWPGSFYEYHKLIPRLTRPSAHGGDPADAFTVVVPSLPGYGFSFTPGQRRFGINEIATICAALMADVLGYQRFSAHGHDWGAFIASRLGYAHPELLQAIHITLLAVPRERSASQPRTADEERFYRQLDHWLKEETGYSKIMGTKPQTLAYALTDSPVGLAAWILEKFRAWSDCSGDIDQHFGRDVLLTNIMLYWVSGAIGSTFWPYYARLHEDPIAPEDGHVSVPTGYAEHPREILTPPRSLVERFYPNIRRWSRMPVGGHFPALEAPDALADDIRAFFRSVER